MLSTSKYLNGISPSLDFFLPYTAMKNTFASNCSNVIIWLVFVAQNETRKAQEKNPLRGGGSSDKAVWTIRIS